MCSYVVRGLVVLFGLSGACIRCGVGVRSWINSGGSVLCGDGSAFLWRLCVGGFELVVFYDVIVAIVGCCLGVWLFGLFFLWVGLLV